MTEALIAIAIVAVQLVQTPQAYEQHVRDTHKQTMRHDASQAVIEHAERVAHEQWHAEQERQPSGYGKWAPILQCESGGDWYISHGLYEGGLQFHPGTWDAYKPSGYPEAAYQATPAQQILVAERVLAAQGWRAWPACSRKAGYR